MTSDDEIAMLADADRRARAWTAGIGRDERRVFPSAESLARLDGFAEPLPTVGRPADETIAMLDEIAGAGVVASNDPRYFGYVVGSALPVAAAAERIASAWDQCASSFDNSPAAHVVETRAGRWVLDALQLPEESAVGFTTSATAGAITALTAARRRLLERQGWDVDSWGLAGAPRIRVVISALAHITVVRALRVLGFGLDIIERVPVDEHGRLDATQMPTLDDRTLVVLQAGEVNTGEFDPFDQVIPAARQAGSWVHVDGAFGLWARASRTHRHLTSGVDGADSWTTDGHKWLNTPYDSAMVIVRNAAALSDAMNSDASYLTGAPDSQKNLTLEFSRRARGIPVWAALRTLGTDGVEDLVDTCIAHAQYAAGLLRDSDLTVLNRCVLNQVLVRAESPDETLAVRERVLRGGRTWFGPAVWQDQPAFRISVSSWRTRRSHMDDLVTELLAHGSGPMPAPSA
ncbi:aminotransferase class V-fold PLP-dependent enzyme [Gordonia sp. OPL2]|uniref:pyridoxal phosphate-dependent decarboxylase family protein n=1 Tax=Gordonia sp. OPL2 TaxID=2486274 RepID=UPI0016554965|nr:aminotransferase class V-fold PLP-dependent enzyme [Gordonia sp. OPL2]ROZ84491.1 aspartate aminotransferase family protein [Gordonia sp. OPL2]